MAEHYPPASRFTLPSLKKYFIAWILIMVTVLIIGSVFLDWQRQTQAHQASRIHAYNQQLERLDTIVDKLALMQSGTNTVVRDKLIQLLDENLDRLASQQKVLQSKLTADQAGQPSSATLASLETQLFDAINMFSGQLAMALVRRDLTQSSNDASQIYQHLMPHYRAIQSLTYSVTESLSARLHQSSEHYRILVWSMVSGIILLMILSGFLIYRQTSALMQQYSELVEKDNANRRQSEETMRRQTQLLEREQMRIASILNAAVDAVLTVTETGRIESFNPAAERLFGYSSNDILGEKLQMLVSPGISNQQTFIERVMTDTEGHIFKKGLEVRAVHQNGQLFPALVSVGEVHQSSPKIYTVIFTDLTTVNSANDNLKKALHEVNAKQAVLDEEARLAQQVFEKITAENKTRFAGLNHWIQPMGAFSGDVVLSSGLPNGVMRVMLCDFTGHGLPAAIGAVPLSMIYSAMTRKGLPIELLMQELNNKLIQSLPGGIFCSISCIDINSKRRVASVWNAGLPHVKQIDAQGRPKHHFKSRHLPLGIQNYTVEEMRCETVRFDDGDSFYLFSDGLTESTNPTGDEFGHMYFDRALNTPISESGRLADIHRQFIQFTADAPIRDDVSIIEINTLITTQAYPLQSELFSQLANS